MGKLQKKQKVRSDKIVLTDKMIGEMCALAGMGLTINEIGAYMRMSRTTIYNLINEYEELALSIDEARSKAHATMAKVCYTMGTKDKDREMVKFWLRAKAGWRDAQKHELAGHDGGPLSPEERFAKKLANMSEDELKKIAGEG